jgi:Holliday junction resolvase RusA-like endonuclease
VVRILHKRPGNHYNKSGLSREGARHPIPTSKPDIDNVLKLVMDALNEHGWDDDKQVVDVVMRRRWGKDGKQGTRVTASEVDVNG